MLTMFCHNKEEYNFPACRHSCVDINMGWDRSGHYLELSKIIQNICSVSSQQRPLFVTIPNSAARSCCLGNSSERQVVQCATMWRSIQYLFIQLYQFCIYRHNIVQTRKLGVWKCIMYSISGVRVLSSGKEGSADHFQVQQSTQSRYISTQSTQCRYIYSVQICVVVASSHLAPSQNFTSDQFTR